jgi:hypothetical protein
MTSKKERIRKLRQQKPGGATIHAVESPIGDQIAEKGLSREELQASVMPPTEETKEVKDNLKDRRGVENVNVSRFEEFVSQREEMKEFELYKTLFNSFTSDLILTVASGVMGPNRVQEVFDAWELAQFEQFKNQKIDIEDKDLPVIKAMITIRQTLADVLKTHRELQAQAKREEYFRKQLKGKGTGKGIIFP